MYASKPSRLIPGMRNDHSINRNLQTSTKYCPAASLTKNIYHTTFIAKDSFLSPAYLLVLENFQAFSLYSLLANLRD